MRGTVRVTAEWALRGKTAGDRGYRLLSWSNGILGQKTFDFLLSRYSPGTLENLPQVTVGWLADERLGDHIGLAIHDQAEGGLHDAVGRAIVSTSYFCVPYEELADGTVSYQALYQRFRGFRLPREDRGPISTGLAVPVPDALPDDTAIRVAALLLTNQPVCILGAGRAGLDERLRFIDTVASLLPYGMRSRLSAATWANSTQGHKFRLFFASAPRLAAGPQAEDKKDRVVTWGQPDRSIIGLDYADHYLDWLTDQVRQPAPRLAGLTGPAGFGRNDVVKLLERLGVPKPGQGRPPGQARVPATARAVEDLLLSCAEQLDSANPGAVKDEIQQLRTWLARPAGDDERAGYRQIIAEHALLRDEDWAGEPLMIDFYQVLLRLAFRTPLTYEGYCQVEACVGRLPGKPLHKSLLTAMWQVGLAELPETLLVLASLDDQELERVLRSDLGKPDRLIRVAVNKELQPSHGRTVCDVILRELRERPRLDRLALQKVLSDSGYLYGMCLRNWREAGWLLETLTGFLGAAHGSRLDSSAVPHILGMGDNGSDGFLPSPVLFAAVLRMVDPEDAGLAARAYELSLITNMGLSPEVCQELLDLLPADSQRPDEDHPGRESRRRRLTHPIRRPAQAD